MRSVLAMLFLLPAMSFAEDCPLCVKAQVTSDYGNFLIDLRPGEPEVLTLGGGYSLALMAAPIGGSGKVRVTADTHYHHNRFSTNVVIGPEKSTWLKVVDLSIEFRVESL